MLLVITWMRDARGCVDLDEISVAEDHTLSVTLIVSVVIVVVVVAANHVLVVASRSRCRCDDTRCR